MKIINAIITCKLIKSLLLVLTMMIPYIFNQFLENLIYCQTLICLVRHIERSLS